MLPVVSFFSLLIVCSGCGDARTITVDPASPANGILSDGTSTWKLSVTSGALEILPYSGPLPATDLLLKDGVSGTTYAITLTSDDALTWTTASSGVGMDSFALADQATGAVHPLSLQNGALTY